MTKAVIAALLLAASTSFAFAAEDQSLSGKEMKDSPTTMGGSTDMPKAKPDDHSLSGKEMKDGATTMGGSTATPNAKPMDGSIQGKEMEDHPGAQK
jgi:hypothetical protein